MKRTQTTITKEYDNDGKLVRETTETVGENDNGFIYPQYPYSPSYLSSYIPNITCVSGGDGGAGISGVGGCGGGASSGGKYPKKM